jgi:hypothetical protein
VTVKKAGQTITVSGAAKIAVAGSSIDVKGDFKYESGKYRFRLNGSGTLVVGGYTLANSTIKFSNFPEDAGLIADITLKAGSVLNVSGKLNIDAEGRFALNANASLNLRVLTVNGNVSFTNKGQNCTLSIEWRKIGPFNFPFFISTCTDTTIPATLSASATVNSSGFSFGVSMTVAANGTFRATARTPVSGETRLQTGTISFLVVRGYAQIDYHMGIVVESSSPYVSVDGAGTASIQYAYWTLWDGWSSYRQLASVSASLKTNPFKACAYASVAGKDVGGCVP